MLFEVDSLDLMSTIAEFCMYTVDCSGICIKFPSAFMSYDQVSSPLLLVQIKTLAYIHVRTVCSIIMQFSVFHSFGPVFSLVKLCRH